MGISGSILRLFSDVFDLDKSRNKLTKKHIVEGILSMKRAYASRTACLRAKDSTSANYADIAYRCAYLHKYAPMHTALVYEVLEKTFTERSDSLQQLSYVAKANDKLCVCSLGGGPGTEIIAITTLLRHHFGLFAPIDATIVDSMPAWKLTFGTLLEQLKSGNYEPLSYSFDSGSFEWNYLGANLLAMTGEEGLNEAIHSADLITMVKFVSAAACKDTADMIQKIFKLLKPGAFVLYIDNDYSTFHHLIENAAKECNFESIFGPLKHEHYVNTLFNSRKCGYTSCFETIVTVHILQKPFEVVSDFSTDTFDMSTNIFETSMSVYDTSLNVFDTSANAFETSMNVFDTSADNFESSSNVFDTSTDNIEVTTNVLDTSTNNCDTRTVVLSKKQSLYKKSISKGKKIFSGAKRVLSKIQKTFKKKDNFNSYKFKNNLKENKHKKKTPHLMSPISERRQPLMMSPISNLKQPLMSSPISNLKQPLMMSPIIDHRQPLLNNFNSNKIQHCENWSHSNYKSYGKLVNHTNPLSEIPYSHETSNFGYAIPIPEYQKYRGYHPDYPQVNLYESEHLRSSKNWLRHYRKDYDPYMHYKNNWLHGRNIDYRNQLPYHGPYYRY